MEMREDFLREKREIFVGSYGHLRKIELLRGCQNRKSM